MKKLPRPSYLFCLSKNWSIESFHKENVSFQNIDLINHSWKLKIKLQSCQSVQDLVSVFEVFELIKKENQHNLGLNKRLTEVQMKIFAEYLENDEPYQLISNLNNKGCKYYEICKVLIGLLPINEKTKSFIESLYFTKEDEISDSDYPPTPPLDDMAPRPLRRSQASLNLSLILK